jgi:hypothetical protein
MKIDPDELDREIDQARRRTAAAQAAMAEGLEAAERKIRDTVASTESVVEDVLSNVKSSISESVDSVKRTFDLPYQTQRHPWLIFGGSVLAGYVLGGRSATRVTQGNGVGSKGEIGSLRSAAMGAIITAVWEIGKQFMSARNGQSDRHKSARSRRNEKLV